MIYQATALPDGKVLLVTESGEVWVGNASSWKRYPTNADVPSAAGDAATGALWAVTASGILRHDPTAEPAAQ